jgi:diguanylate cyclase (GGDEF)-like protein
MKKNLREVDIVARLGGEEFGILLPNTPQQKAIILAERLRAEIKNLSFQDQSPNLNITLSGGISFCCEEISNLDDLMRAADKGLYQAKAEGRNKIVISI